MFVCLDRGNFNEFLDLLCVSVLMGQRFVPGALMFLCLDRTVNSSWIFDVCVFR